ncbi:MAG: CPBP family intramembrane metalloprotease [Anaerolineaceae bacterium]|nr:CPBP family intramembrane metalloprotease [Anaerolineaceae bacterium]
MADSKIWNIITALELAAAAVVILLDLFMPTLVILAMILLSLLIRREELASLGFKRPQSWLRMAGLALLCGVFLQLFHVSVTMPVLNRLTGTTINYSGFTDIQGNMGQLALFLVLSWTLAGLGEEMVYRGYLQKLGFSLFGGGLLGIALTFGISSLLFGLAHTEQGFIGVVLSMIDGLFFSWLKLKFNNNLWAAVLAHAIGNSIGVVVFYFTGPIYGLW